MTDETTPRTAGETTQEVKTTPNVTEDATTPAVENTPNAIEDATTPAVELPPRTKDEMLADIERFVTQKIPEEENRLWESEQVKRIQDPNVKRLYIDYLMWYGNDESRTIEPEKQSNVSILGVADLIATNPNLSKEEKNDLYKQLPFADNPITLTNPNLSTSDVQELEGLIEQSPEVVPEELTMFAQYYVSQQKRPTEPSKIKKEMLPAAKPEPAAKTDKMDNTLYTLLTNPKLKLDTLQSLLTPEDQAKLPKQVKQAYEQTRQDLEKLQSIYAAETDDEKKKELEAKWLELEKNELHLAKINAQLNGKKTQLQTTQTPESLKKGESDYLINARRLKEIEEAKKTADEQKKKELEQEEEKLKKEQTNLIENLGHTPHVPQEPEKPLNPALNSSGNPIAPPLAQTNKPDDAAINNLMAGAQAEQQEESWWSRNKTWLLWTLGGLVLGVVGFFGFKKGGWWNKEKKSTPTSTPTAETASVATTAGLLNTNTNTNMNTNTGSTLENSGVKVNTNKIDQTNTVMNEAGRTL